MLKWIFQSIMQSVVLLQLTERYCLTTFSSDFDSWILLESFCWLTEEWGIQVYWKLYKYANLSCITTKNITVMIIVLFLENTREKNLSQWKGNISLPTLCQADARIVTALTFISIALSIICLYTPIENIILCILFLFHGWIWSCGCKMYLNA